MKKTLTLILIALLVVVSVAAIVGGLNSASSAIRTPGSRIQAATPMPALYVACGFPPCDCSAGC